MRNRVLLQFDELLLDEFLDLIIILMTWTLNNEDVFILKVELYFENIFDILFNSVKRRNFTYQIFPLVESQIYGVGKMAQIDGLGDEFAI